MVVAVASPPPAPAGGPRHPPYKEMILNAVGSLGERRGATRRAISRFIASNYSNLHARHQSLLGVHLRRLRTSGVLALANHTYKLAAVDHTPVALPRSRGRPRKNPVPVQLDMAARSSAEAGVVQKNSFDPPATAVRRRPGRPKKVALTDGEHQTPPVESAPESTAGVFARKRSRGRPTKYVDVASVSPTTSSMLSNPGIEVRDDQTQPRRRGRPAKAGMQGPTLCDRSKVKAGNVPGIVERGVGRPRKTEKVFHASHLSETSKNENLPNFAEIQSDIKRLHHSLLQLEHANSELRQQQVITFDAMSSLKRGQQRLEQTMMEILDILHRKFPDTRSASTDVLNILSSAAAANDSLLSSPAVANDKAAGSFYGNGLDGGNTW